MNGKFKGPTTRLTKGSSISGDGESDKKQQTVLSLHWTLGGKLEGHQGK